MISFLRPLILVQHQRGRGIGSRFQLAVEHIAVSYTHLDVYKRQLLGLLADIDGAKFLRLLVYHVDIAEVLAILGTLGTVPVEDVVMIPAWFAHQEINMTHQSEFAKPYHEPYLV